MTEAPLNLFAIGLEKGLSDDFRNCGVSLPELTLSGIEVGGMPTNLSQISSFGKDPKLHRLLRGVDVTEGPRLF